MLSIYNGKTVLVTGHTGFKGSWLCSWLDKLGAKVIGLSHDFPSDPCHFTAANIGEKLKDYRFDIRNLEKVKGVIYDVEPDFVFHLAAQALVRPSYENPIETMEVNAIGSANILEAVRHLSKKVVALMITSDKAYDNVEWVWGYRETDKLGGKDPYSASKGMAELAIRSFVESYLNSEDSNVVVGITRAGNVIGGGDWAKDRIVPDCVKAWAREGVVEIRSPRATRPWQHVLEPLSGYLTLGAKLAESNRLHGEAYNFGPAAHNNQSVEELIEAMSEYWSSVRWKDVSDENQVFHEAGLLKLNCDKALLDLKWMPTLEFDDTVRMTVEWYKAFYDGSVQIGRVTERQIEEYTQLATRKNMVWVEND